MPDLERIAEADKLRLEVLQHQKKAGQQALAEDVRELEETKVQVGHSQEVLAMQGQQETKTMQRQEKAAATKLQSLAKMMAAKREVQRLREQKQAEQKGDLDAPDAPKSQQQRGTKVDVEALVRHA